MALHRAPESGPTYAFEVHHDHHVDVPSLTAEGLNTEWLLTNGLGGFAMGSVVGVNTRRYHGLLVASPHPPVDRRVTVAAMHETLVIDGQPFDLDNHEFHSGHGGSVFNPKGWQLLRRFEKSTLARWVYHVRQYTVTKELRLVWKKQRALLTYRIEPATGSIRSYDLHGAPVGLQLRPLMAMRDFHHHRVGADDAGLTAEHVGDRAVIVATGPESMPVHIVSDGGVFTPAREWWSGFRHRVDSERQQDDREDLFSPGYFERTFEHVGRDVCELRVCIDVDPVDFATCDADDGRHAHLAKLFAHVRKQVAPTVERKDLEGLVVASDDFVVDRKVGGRDYKTILAGYPWFADWGRDTMISLPGLLLTTGRYAEALQTLGVFAAHIRNGLVPNRFDDYGGQPHYNTVDASLWFIHAALEYHRLAADKAAWNDVLAPACRSILDAYAAGTDGPIAMDDDGLITAGDEHTQLTWMDAKRDGVVFTPRHGKAVEINALWYRGLIGVAEQIAGEDRVAAGRYKKLANRAKRNFAGVFWNEHLGHLNDVVNERGPDGACRPNQLLAVSLPASMLSITHQKKVMLAVRERLLTPVGLRTLSPDHFHYKPRFTGSMFQRDEAYHQGTVWPWLIGPYVEGWLRAHKFSSAAKDHGREALRGLLQSLRENMGQLHEIYDAEPPHHPDGCPAQAWSVAETLRAMVLVESA